MYVDFSMSYSIFQLGQLSVMNEGSLDLIYAGLNHEEELPVQSFMMILISL